MEDLVSGSIEKPLPLEISYCKIFNCGAEDNEEEKKKHCPTCGNRRALRIEVEEWH